MASSPSKLGDSKITISKVSDAKYAVSLSSYEKVFTLFTKDYAMENMPAEISSGSSQITINKEGKKITFAASPKYPACAAEAQTIKVCAVSKNVKVNTTNPVTGDFSENPLTFRFAFLPPNTPPPDVLGVTAEDLKRAGKSVMISWLKSPAANVVNYSIYAQNSDFGSRKLEDLKIIPVVTVDAQSAIEIKTPINLVPKCRPVAGTKTCIFEIADGIKTAPGTLIYDSTSDRYYYMLNVADNMPMNFGVTAVNKKGLQSTGFRETPLATSVDDIPPGYVSVIEDPATKSYGWSVPINIDGSVIEDALKTQLQYDIIVQCAGGMMVNSAVMATNILQNAIRSDCAFKGVIAKKPVKQAGITKYTPDLMNPYDESDKEIINYLLQ
jgi:hypothetical protein